jgi:hypothetical protein
VTDPSLLAAEFTSFGAEFSEKNRGSSVYADTLSWGAIFWLDTSLTLKRGLYHILGSIISVLERLFLIVY